MAYTNSPLVSYTKISPMKDSTRKHSTHNPNGVIDKITIHHMAGNLSVETCGNVFQTREASSNYGVGSDGRVGMYVEEKHRAWTSSSPANDYRAVTIEVANDGGAPQWHVSDKALAKTIELCVDICKRNGIKKLNYTGDSKGNLTRHNMFAATTCPGPYLQSKFEYIASEVNKKLEVKEEKAETKPTTTNTTTKTIKKGDLVSIVSGAKWYDGGSIDSWVIAKKWYVEEVSGSRVVINKSEDKVNAIMSPIDVKYLKNAETKKAETKKEEKKFESYLVRVTASALNVRAKASHSAAVNTVIKDKGIYTIVGEENGFGKLKSGAGWIDLKYTEKYTEEKKSEPSYTIYTVKKNDSLWVIAEKLLGDGDRYPEIKKLNGLTSDIIYPDQKLKVPKK